MRCLAMSTVFTHGHLPRVPRARQSPLVTKISWRRPQSRRQHFLAPVAAADVCPPGRCSSAHSTNSTIRNPLSALSLSAPPAPQTSLPMAFSLRPGRDWPLWSGLYGHQHPLGCLLPPSLGCQLKSCTDVAAHLGFATSKPQKNCVGQLLT